MFVVVVIVVVMIVVNGRALISLPFFFFRVSLWGWWWWGVQVAVSAESLKGNSIRKALVREAKNHGASAVIVGITRHSAMG